MRVGVGGGMGCVVDAATGLSNLLVNLVHLSKYIKFHTADLVTARQRSLHTILDFPCQHPHLPFLQLTSTTTHPLTHNSTLQTPTVTMSSRTACPNGATCQWVIDATHVQEYTYVCLPACVLCISLVVVGRMYCMLALSLPCVCPSSLSLSVCNNHMIAATLVRKVLLVLRKASLNMHPSTRTQVGVCRFGTNTRTPVLELNTSPCSLCCCVLQLQHQAQHQLQHLLQALQPPLRQLRLQVLCTQA